MLLQLSRSPFPVRARFFSCANSAPGQEGRLLGVGMSAKPINSVSQRPTGFGGGTRRDAGAKVSVGRAGGIVGRGFRPKARVECSASDFAARKKRRRRSRGVRRLLPGGSYPLRMRRHRRRFGFPTATSRQSGSQPPNIFTR